HIGERTTKTFNSMDGNPCSENLGVGLPWLAFCSGTYLKRPHRRLPMPGGWDKDVYFDKTVVFNDGFGLPKSVEFYRTDTRLSAKYQVEQSTNALGWSFPSQFSIIFYREGLDGAQEVQGSAYGRV